ncbi:MAG: hypothetical protein R3F60_04290 [bacterium]
MPRVRGPMAARPEGDGPLLNGLLFGDHDRGGYDVAVRPEVLPWSWPAVFGRTAPLTLEIGFNRGKFLSELARAWPDHDHVGIEVSRRFAWRLHHILLARGPANVRIVWADARAATPALFTPGSLQAVFINFPDPWWKKRHHKRRLVQGPFAAQLAELPRAWQARLGQVGCGRHRWGNRQSPWPPCPRSASAPTSARTTCR